MISAVPLAKRINPGAGKAPTLPSVRSSVCVGDGLGLALREGWVDMSPESWIDPANCMDFALVLPLQAKLGANRGKQELPTHIN